jgi:DNA-binding transcriptional ArsR family regulator
MNLSPDLIFNDGRIAQPISSSSGCDLDCKATLFRNLADRSRLSILEALCQGTKTVSQIAAATNLSQSDVSSQLGRLLDCGCVTSKHARNSVLYELSAPRLLQLEAVADEILLASLKHRVPDQD